MRPGSARADHGGLFRGARRGPGGLARGLSGQRFGARLMPTNPNPTVRLYLATLPPDMKGERALLAKEVFPELTQAAARLGLDLVVLDPAEGPEAWDLERRLDAISSCQIFMAFLGERYGEPPAAIPESLVARYPF